MAIEKLGQLSQYATIDDNDVNKLFTKLEEVRQKQAAKSGAFPSQAVWTEGEPVEIGPGQYLPGQGHITYVSTTPDPFATNIAIENNTIDPTYPTKIKEDLEKLEQSKYISSSYSNQIVIPTSLETYISAAEHYNKYVNIINNLIDICPHDAANYSDYAHNSPDNADKSDHSNDSPVWYNNGNNSYVMGHSGFCNSSGGI